MAEEIETIFGHDDLAPFLNTRHAVYKEQGFANALPPRKNLIEWILAEPNLLRRPITRRDVQVLIGFDKDRLTALVK